MWPKMAQDDGQDGLQKHTSKNSVSKEHKSGPKIAQDDCQDGHQKRTSKITVSKEHKSGPKIAQDDGIHVKIANYFRYKSERSFGFCVGYKSERSYVAHKFISFGHAA